jgi:hypothetical protein
MRAQVVVVWITGTALAAMFCWYDFATVEKIDERGDENRIVHALHSGREVKKSSKSLIGKRSSDGGGDSQDVQLMHCANAVSESVVLGGTSVKTEITTAGYYRGGVQAGRNGRDRSADESLTNDESSPEDDVEVLKSEERQVAATVSGQPIFVDDILRQIPLEQADWLAAIQREATPADYRRIRGQVVKIHLTRHIEQELLLQDVRSKLDMDQLEGIERLIDALFEEECLAPAMNHAGVTNMAEFQEALGRRGRSIDGLRSQFRNRELAQQYLGAKCLPKTGFDPPDVLKYYQEHKEDYAIPAKTKWEHIRLLFSKNGGEDEAMEKAAKILERLNRGEQFAAIARECSDGPTASSDGGLRDWTSYGTLINEELERALREQPLGEIGPPIETASAIEIVRVIDRKPSGYQPIEAVQDDIKMLLKNTLWKQSTSALIKELREKATIETFVNEL